MIPTFPTSLYTYNDLMFHALAELNGRARAVGDGSPTDGDEMTDLPTLTTGPEHRHTLKEECFPLHFPLIGKKKDPCIDLKDKECDIEVSDMRKIPPPSKKKNIIIY